MNNIRIIVGILRVECRDWLDVIISAIPGHVGDVVRSRVWCSRLLQHGKNIKISRGCLLFGHSNIKIGDDSSFYFNTKLYAINNGKLTIGKRSGTNLNVLIDASDDGEIVIGDNVIIAPNVVIRSSNHLFDKTNIPIRDQGHCGGKIVIENDVWIGSNVVILPGVTIGCGSVIGAGAVVSKNIPPMSLAVGVPARVIRKRI